MSMMCGIKKALIAQFKDEMDIINYCKLYILINNCMK